MTEDRKARLAALTAAAKKSGRTNPTESTSSELEKQSDIPTTKTINFRNYVPKDGNLDKADSLTKRLKRSSGEDIDAENDVGAKEDSKTELELALEEAKKDAAILRDASQTSSATQVEAVVAAPKKVNWDLKRDIAKKLNRLEKRTQKAIVDLLREKLEREAEEEEDGDLD